MMMMIITSQIYFISDVFSSVAVVVALTFLYHKNGMSSMLVSSQGGALKNRL